MFLSAVPFATIAPFTVNEKSPPNLTSTPGSIVSVAPGLTVTLLERTMGLSTRVHTVSCVIAPSTYVALTVGRVLYTMLREPNTKVNRMISNVNCFFMRKHPLCS